MTLEAFFFPPSLRKFHIKTELITAECHLLGFHVRKVHWAKKREKQAKLGGRVGVIQRAPHGFTSHFRALQLCSADIQASLQEH